MIIIGAMTVFTTDGSMGRILDVGIFVLMTFPADHGGLVFYRYLLPVGFVGLAVPSIHIAPLIDPEITGY